MDSPDSPVGSGGKLSAELRTKADLAEALAFPSMNKRDDLRIAALEKYAAERSKGTESFPLIPAANVYHSPNKTASTLGSDTVLGHDLSLRRQGSGTFSTGAIPRSSRNTSPAKRPTAAVLENYEDIVGRASTASPSQDNNAATDERYHSAEVAQPAASDDRKGCGLDFLLQACDILEPVGSAPLGSIDAAVEGHCAQDQAQQPTRAHRRARSFTEEAARYSPAHSSDDEEYRPSRRGRQMGGRRAAATAARAASAAAAPREAMATASAPAAPAAAGSTGSARWERGLVTGPCTNPDCEHPYDSPQWRKGPPQNPILCNACGTRWLRNGTLKPLVPRRGIRYGKARPKGSVKAAAEAKAEAAARAKAAAEAKRAEAAQRRQLEAMVEEEEYEETTDAEPMVEHSTGGATTPTDIFPTVLPTIPGLAAAGPLFPFFSNISDPVALQQQLEAMTAAAQAAQQALAVAQAAMAQRAEGLPMKPAGVPPRPVFHIQAVAGTAFPGTFPSATGGDEPMQTDFMS